MVKEIIEGIKETEAKAAEIIEEAKKRKAAMIAKARDDARKKVDEARKRGRQRAVAHLAEVDDVAEAEDPERELKDHLAACLDRLDPGSRALVEAKYLEGRSYADLARELALSPKAVESRLARVRKKLRQMILGRLRQ